MFGRCLPDARSASLARYVSSSLFCFLTWLGCYIKLLLSCKPGIFRWPASIVHDYGMPTFGTRSHRSLVSRGNIARRSGACSLCNCSTQLCWYDSGVTNFGNGLYTAVHINFRNDLLEFLHMYRQAYGHGAHENSPMLKCTSVFLFLGSTAKLYPESRVLYRNSPPSNYVYVHYICRHNNLHEFSRIQRERKESFHGGIEHLASWSARRA